MCGALGDSLVLLVLRIRLLSVTVSAVVHGMWLPVPAEALAFVLRSEQPVESGELGHQLLPVTSGSYIVGLGV